MFRRKNAKGYFIFSSVFLILFVIVALLVSYFDVAPIGPLESSIGLSRLNQAALEAIGSSTLCYDLSELLGTAAVLLPLFFGILAMVQWIRRKHILRVDVDLFGLFAVYALTASAYVLFEIFIINYRPILIEGALEASFPSSHTLLAIVIFGTAIEEIRLRITRSRLKIALQILAGALMVLTVVLRLLSGVHWISDILAGTLLGAALVSFFNGLVRITKNRSQNKED